MSNKTNYKKFVIDSRSDYIVYLRMIIVQSHKLLKRLNKYSDELNHKIDELNLRNKPNALFDTEIYEEFNDKIGNVEHRLLNIVGDLQTDSISYYKFRKMLLKRNIEVKNDLGTLSEEMESNLSTVNVSRNWALHMPESLLHAQIENIKEIWDKKELQEFLTKFNPVGVPYFKKYQGKWLISLYEQCVGNLSLYEEVYKSMLSDYEKLLGIEPIINEIQYGERDFESEIKLPQTSFAMQQRKYNK
ncbi:hypothetical protein [Bacillus massiliglaciei]|uniref:hypothetical protein n=1 Tax=Bacillus massiliglaciei TaxID=1816693 RepID=UPI000A7770C4|nr:hypothetical protein [Bacillus massiliglaciei]